MTVTYKNATAAFLVVLICRSRTLGAGSAGDTQEASQQLVEMSEQLRSLVGQFRINTDEAGKGAAVVANAPVKGMTAHASA